MTSDETGRFTDDTDRWDSEDEFLEWLDDFCDYAVACYRTSTAKYPDGDVLIKAQKARGIQNDLKSGEISFQEALERYGRELRTDTDRPDPSTEESP